MTIFKILKRNSQFTKSIIKENFSFIQQLVYIAVLYLFVNYPLGFSYFISLKS